MPCLHDGVQGVAHIPYSAAGLDWVQLHYERWSSQIAELAARLLHEVLRVRAQLNCAVVMRVEAVEANPHQREAHIDCAATSSCKIHQT